MNRKFEKSSGDLILDYNNLSPENTKRLNFIAREISKEYTEFVDDCCRKYGNDYLFWATPLASRNVFNDSDTYLSLCRIMLTRELTASNDICKVITEYKSEQRVLQQCLDESVRVECSEKTTFGDIIYKYLKTRLEFFKLIKTEAIYKHLVGKKESEKNEYDDIVITPVLSSGFDNYHYCDRYFTGITEYRPVTFIPMLNNNLGITSKEFITNVRHCDNYHFLFHYSYLKTSDFWKIAKYHWLVDRIKNDTFVFKKIDISPFVKRCLVCGKYNTPAIKGILFGEAIKRMAQRGVKVKNFCLWYEGRPSEMMITSAIRSCFPNAGCVGYEGYPIEDINMGLYISSYQYQTSHAPKVVAVPGEAYEEYARQYCRDVKVIYAPILRNDYEISRRKQRSNQCLRLLVVLPFFVNTAKELLRMIDAYIVNNTSPIELLIKNHPVFDEYGYKDYGLAEPCHSYEFLHGSLKDCLDNVDIAIMSCTSSSMEAVFAGVHLIIWFENGRLGFSALPRIIEDSCSTIVYGENELFFAINKFLSDHKEVPYELEHVLVDKTRDNVERMFL